MLQEFPLWIAFTLAVGAISPRSFFRHEDHFHGAIPLATATLQSSTDLGIADAWGDLTTLPVNVNGSASFTEVPDPSAAGSPRNFYRVKILGP